MTPSATCGLLCPRRPAVPNGQKARDDLDQALVVVNADPAHGNHLISPDTR